MFKVKTVQYPQFLIIQIAASGTGINLCCYEGILINICVEYYSMAKGDSNW